MQCPRLWQLRPAFEPMASTLAASSHALLAAAAAAAWAAGGVRLVGLRPPLCSKHIKGGLLLRDRLMPLHKANMTAAV